MVRKQSLPKCTFGVLNIPPAPPVPSLAHLVLKPARVSRKR